jgi:predicted acetyltransferase
MYEIRNITPEEAGLFRSRLSRGFGGDVESGTADVERFEALIEYDRTVAVFDGDDIIGTGGGVSFTVSVPGGGEVPMAGTSLITVQPTHRRRGVLRSIMAHHLDDVAGRGEPLAGLWASESSIYGRFGYGQGTFRHDATMDSGRVDFRGEPAKGAVRLVETEEAGRLMRSVYEQARPNGVGMLTRSDAWWDHRLLGDPESRRGGKSEKRYAVFEEDGKATGYAVYRQKSNWDDFISNGEIDVSEIVTTTDTAHTGLWQFLTNIDLFPKLEYWNAAVDDPLPAKILDPRRVVRKLADALWIRVMDVPAALEARRYDADGVVTIDVIDPTGLEAAGTYQLQVSEGVGSCELVTATADLSFQIDVLGHLYLGGGDAFAMAAAGRIDGDPRAVWRLHRMFRTDRAPWCPEVF